MRRELRQTTLISLLAIGLSFLVLPSVRATDKKVSDPSKTHAKNKKKKAVHRGFRIGPKHTTHYVVDPDSSRNQVTFTSKAPRETITGKSNIITGHLDLKPRRLAKAKGRFSVAWKSIDTGNGMRNQHMLSAPWADTKKYPDIVFTLKGIAKVKRKGKSGKSVRARLIGTFAMNGAEKDFKIPATLVYLKPNKGDKVTEGIGIRCKFTIALKDFNIKGRGIGQGFAAEEQVKVSLFLKRAKKTESDTVEDEPTQPTS